MFEGHFPISLWLCKYEKKSYDLKIHQDAPYILAISLCVCMCVHCLCVHVCAHVNGFTHVCACMLCVHIHVCGWVYPCMCLCLCVQMGVFIACVCMHVCGGVHMHMSVHTCVQMGVCRQVCVCSLHVCAYVWGYAHVCGWVCTHVCVHCICVCMCMCVQMDVCTCVCAHICVSALSGAHKMEPYCQNNAILTAGISKDIRSSNSVTCRETLSRSRIKYTTSPGSLQATRQKELPASQCRWPSRRHSRRLSSVDQPVNPSSFHGFVCFSCEGK